MRPAACWWGTCSKIRTSPPRPPLPVSGCQHDSRPSDRFDGHLSRLPSCFLVDLPRIRRKRIRGVRCSQVPTNVVAGMCSNQTRTTTSRHPTDRSPGPIVALIERRMWLARDGVSIARGWRMGQGCNRIARGAWLGARAFGGQEDGMFHGIKCTHFNTRPVARHSVLTLLALSTGSSEGNRLSPSNKGRSLTGWPRIRFDTHISEASTVCEEIQGGY